MTSAILAQSSAGLFPVLIAIVVYGIPILTVVSVCRSLRGGLRVFWVVLIVGGFIFIPLIGIILSVGFLAFKGRFVDIQRSSI